VTLVSTPHEGPAVPPAPAVLTIDLGAIAANWRWLSSFAGPTGAVVKADAYGLGLEPVARCLLRAGCRDFFVAQADEGRQLRDLCDAARHDSAIYVLNGLDGTGLGFYRRFRLRPVLSTPRDVAIWLDPAGAGVPAALHFDTGINRLGLPMDAATAISASLRPRRFDLCLLISHFAASEDGDTRANAEQVARFAALRAQFSGIPASLANSSGIFLASRPHYDLVRPGYALFGGNPVKGRANPMRPVVGLAARIIQMRDVAPGATVGYGATWTAIRPTRLAVVSLGYADGLPRLAGASDTRAGCQAMVGNRLCPIVGRVSMDLAAVDVSTVEDEALLEPGASIAFLNEAIGIDAMAESAQTIGYTILTGLGRRPHRHYRGDDG
jgi:alanine racemase